MGNRIFKPTVKNRAPSVYGLPNAPAKSGRQRHYAVSI